MYEIERVDYGVVSFEGNRESTGKERGTHRGMRDRQRKIIQSARALSPRNAHGVTYRSALSIAIASRKRLIFPSNPSSARRGCLPILLPFNRSPLQNLTDFHYRTILISRKKRRNKCDREIALHRQIQIYVSIFTYLRKCKNSFFLSLSHRKDSVKNKVFPRVRSLKSFVHKVTFCSLCVRCSISPSNGTYP